jgi:hypothetical protein
MTRPEKTSLQDVKPSKEAAPYSSSVHLHVQEVTSEPRKSPDCEETRRGWT